MKFHQIILLIALSVLTFSCVDTLTDYGLKVQPTTDQIQIGTDTFHLNTETDSVEYIYSKPDSFLLGDFFNVKYGSTRADILAQVNSMEGSNFTFPENAQPDSALVILYYKSWFGDGYSPFEVNIYQMNLNDSLVYSNSYRSNLDPLKYSDRSNLLGSGIFKAKDVSRKYSDSTALVIKLSDNFVTNFFNGRNYFTNEAKFLHFFRGMYITTNFGASTLLNVEQIDLEYYYHYTAKVSGVDKKISNMLIFPANTLVRQVNRFKHDNRPTVTSINDSVNWVASPANFQTRIVLPLNRIKDSIDKKIPAKNGVKQIVNKAILQVKATQVEDSTLSTPLVSYMLLIKETEVDNFFKKKELPADTSTVAVLSQIYASEIGTTGTYEYFYNYDVARIIANELKKNPTPQPVPMVLVPVEVVSSTSSTTGATTYSSVKQQQKMSAVVVRSGKVKDSKTGLKIKSEPMHLKLIYSGF